jgi:hypothetical protein
MFLLYSISLNVVLIFLSVLGLTDGESVPGYLYCVYLLLPLVPGPQKKMKLDGVTEGTTGILLVFIWL